jgi:hypothetical protein
MVDTRRLNRSFFCSLKVLSLKVEMSKKIKVVRFAYCPYPPLLGIKQFIGGVMTKRYREELRQEPTIKIFCMTCRRVFGCKGRITGGNRHECSNCDTRMYCVAGILVDNIPVEMQKKATSGFCPTCYQKRLQDLDARKTLTP